MCLSMPTQWGCGEDKKPEFKSNLARSFKRDQLLWPALLQPAPMATETDWNCPVCRDGAGEKASVSPCLHQFCLGCVVRWLKRKPSCPLCRQPIKSIIYSVRSEEDFLELVLPSSSDSSAAGQQDEQGAVQLMASTYV
uniref:RING-type E3 ubiquitin transferase n=1 Tax=Ficedula albicollis TaxID=59894 RepID=A0A803VUK1_FICAL